MYKTLGIRNSRIEVADALRGIAVIGIILYHAVEQFDTLQAESATYSFSFDPQLFDWLGVILSGKMYGIFAVLFGLSFFIMRDNQEQKGRDFSLRFLWRMVLLLIIGYINMAFYNGDILTSYAIFGVLMIPAGYLSNKWLWPLTIVLLMQPVEVYSLITGWSLSPEVAFSGFGPIVEGHTQGTFLQNATASVKGGLWCSWMYFIYSGRLTQTIGLFFLGILLGRYRMFYDEGNHLKIWRYVCAITGVLAITGKNVDLGTWANLLNPLVNCMMILFVISGVTLLWYASEGFRHGLRHICFFGRMSMTNYLLQSVLGSFIFYHWGLGMYQHLGTLWSFLVGVGIVVLQIVILYQWSRFNERGPMETVWRRLTWIG